MKLLISFALASNRAILLPRQGIYVASNGSLYPRNIWTLYPIGEVESRFGVKILEPNYVEHASSFLLPNSPEVAKELVSDVKELRVVVEVDDTPDLGMTSFWSLLDELITQPYRDAKVVRLIWGPREDTLDKWRGRNEIPSTKDRGEVRVCKHIEVRTAALGCVGFRAANIYLTYASSTPGGFGDPGVPGMRRMVLTGVNPAEGKPKGVPKDEVDLQPIHHLGSVWRPFLSRVWHGQRMLLQHRKAGGELTFFVESLAYAVTWNKACLGQRLSNCTFVASILLSCLLNFFCKLASQTSKRM